MSRRNAVLTFVAASASLLLAGCMPKMTIAEMKAAMPERPAELDRLNAFVGKWQYEGTAKFAMLDQPLKAGGHSEGQWEGNGWYLVNRSVMTMEHFDDSQALEAWSYDVHAKKYRSMWVDSMGMMGTGEATYDDPTRTWHWKGTSHSPWGPSSIKGTMHFVDDDSVEWTFTEHMGLMKTTEMSGTGKRVK